MKNIIQFFQKRSPEIDCDEMRPDLSALADGELDKEKGNALKRHLEKCRKCRDTLSAYKNLSGIIQSYDKPSLSPNFEAGVFALLESEKEPSRLPFLRYAAAGIIALAAVYVYNANTYVSSDLLITDSEISDMQADALDVFYGDL